MALAFLCGCVAVAEASPVVERSPSIQTRLGIWYRPEAPFRNQLWAPGDPGQPLFLRGRVVNVRGVPIGGALLEVWHADADGFVETNRFRARLYTADDGTFRLTTVLPGYIFGPRHIHFQISHEQHPTLVTRIFFKRDPVRKLHQYEAVLVVLEDGVIADGIMALFGTLEFVMAP